MRVFSRLLFTFFTGPHFLTLCFVVILLFVFIGFSGWLDQKQEVQGEQTQACLKLEKPQALENVRKYSEIEDYYNELELAGGVPYENIEKTDDWVFHVQIGEVKDGHTATFNWYTLDSCGALKCSMFEYKEGRLVRPSESYPC